MDSPNAESDSAASTRADESLTGRMGAFIAWVRSGGGREWVLSRIDARRIVDEIEWGWAAAERETDLATKLDEATVALVEAHKKMVPIIAALAIYGEQASLPALVAKARELNEANRD